MKRVVRGERIESRLRQRRELKLAVPIREKNVNMKKDSQSRVRSLNAPRMRGLLASPDLRPEQRLPLPRVHRAQK